MTKAAAIDPATALPVVLPLPATLMAPPDTGADPQDPLADLARLRRPRLLIRAARFGLNDYHRGRDLRRLLGHVPRPGPGLLAELLAVEATQETARAGGDAAWRPARHVETLVAVMAEARLLRAACADQENASDIEAFRLAT